jgi:hypothetical protein
MISKIEKVLVDQSMSRFCDMRVPAHIRDKVRLIYRWRGSSVTLFETRPYFQDPKRWTECPVAQFRYNATNKRWVLYCANRNGRWFLYDEAKPATSIQTLLDEVNRDPTHIFWG